MSESDVKIVQELLDSNEDFKALHVLHGQLKIRVRDAEQGISPIDDMSLGTMKKEKLLAKDKMAAMIERHRVAQTN